MDTTERRDESQRSVVLLVEDDPNVRKAFTLILQREGHEVVVAEDGETAVRALADRSLDVIVSDIRLPGLSGVELLRAVREVDLDLPVILMTGWPQVETAAEAVELGALQYLQKPVRPRLLLDAVDRAIRLHALARAQREALALVGSGARSAGDRAGLGALFDRSLKHMTMALQPIVRADNPARVFAFEALLRGGDPGLHDPEEVLQAAADLGRSTELGQRTRELSSHAIDRIPDDVFLFINLRARDLLHQGLSAADAPLTSATVSHSTTSAPATRA
jgi:CheY-like chemotaxis protein